MVRRKAASRRLASSLDTLVVPPQRASSVTGPPRSAPRLTVIMAAFNEERTIQSAVLDVLGVDLPCELELIVVDDGSSDATSEILAAIDDPRLRVVRHHTNLGKGTAMRTGRRLATGSHIVPFDADLEYRAADLARLIEPALTHGYDVVIGTRAGARSSDYASYRFALGNRVLTKVANVAFDAHISDLHSCLKLVSADLLRSLPLRETGFAADTELVAALLKRGIHPYEVPIAYRGRTRAEGKKIRWRDAVECVTTISRHRIAAAEDVPRTHVVIDLTHEAPHDPDDSDLVIDLRVPRRTTVETP